MTSAFRFIEGSWVESPVADEKLHLPPKQSEFRGYKMPRKPRKSAVDRHSSRFCQTQTRRLRASSQIRPSAALWSVIIRHPLDNTG